MGAWVEYRVWLAGCMYDGAGCRVQEVQGVNVQQCGADWKGSRLWGLQGARSSWCKDVTGARRFLSVRFLCGVFMGAWEECRVWEAWYRVSRCRSMVQSERGAGCEEYRVQDIKRTKGFFVKSSCVAWIFTDLTQIHEFWTFFCVDFCSYLSKSSIFFNALKWWVFL